MTPQQAADYIVHAIGAEPDAPREARLLVYDDADHDPCWTGHPTAHAHRAYIREVGRLIQEAGIRPVVITFAPRDYETWQQANSAPDSRAARSAWAAQTDFRYGVSLGTASIGWCVYRLGGGGEWIDGGEDAL